MNNIGKFKWMCGDCGCIKLLRRNDLSYSRTRRPVCPSCGGKMWQPVTRNAQVDFVRASVAREATNKGNSRLKPAHRSMLAAGSTYAYAGTRLIEKESRATKISKGSGKPLWDSADMPVGIFTAPPIGPKEREPLFALPPKPLGKAKRRESVLGVSA